MDPGIVLKSGHRRHQWSNNDGADLDDEFMTDL